MNICKCEENTFKKLPFKTFDTRVKKLDRVMILIFFLTSVPALSREQSPS
jgi:hypothetical protein